MATASSRAEFDAIVIGTGFGGAVMAAELAEAGMSVCVLERGKPYPPGSFPRSPRSVGRNFWDPDTGMYGMFDVWSFRHSEALVCSGLGGGSLIYANVLLRKPEAWFREPLPNGGSREWPVTRADLEPHYDAVERVLGATPYPFDQHPYSTTPKTRHLQAAASELGLEWALPKLAITFAAQPSEAPRVGVPIREQEANLHDQGRSTCRLCGECDLGCNYGSKNTLDYNYLSAAKRAGAEIRTLCEVKRIRPGGGISYAVEYLAHGEHAPNGEGDPAIRQTITATRVILSAGTLGSTYLLLKSRENLPNLSSQLGTRYSTNGDLLTFALRCCDQASGLTKEVDPSFGPVITSAIVSDLGNDGRFVLEDAGFPDMVSWLVETTQAPGVIRRAIGYVVRRIIAHLTNDPCSEVDSQFAQLIGSADLSASSLPLLGMGCDRADGTMTLRRRRRDGKRFLAIDWRRKGSRAYFDGLDTLSRRVAEAMGGRFVQNPGTALLKRVITVHPLGGCPMGRSAREGVVDEHGRVFGYPGLLVADGSVMPGPVGVNPSLTIAALSRRFAHRLIEDSRTTR